MGLSLSNQAVDIQNDFIKKLVESNRIVIFSKSGCGYCVKAKDALKRLNQKYHAVELDDDSNCPESDCDRLIQKLILQTRMKTVPQIFVDGSLIGGYTDLQQMIDAGKFNDEKRV